MAQTPFGHKNKNKDDRIKQLEMEVLLLRDGYFQLEEMATKLKAAEAEIREYSETLEKKVEERTQELSDSNRLKDLFIDIMRHDLLNPIANVKMGAQFVAINEEQPKKKETLQLIDKSCNKLVNMIKNASVFAKLESEEKLELEKMEIGSVLKDAIAEMTAKAKEKGVAIKAEIENEFYATANHLIGDVFSNLISNAIKYGNDTSDIVVNIKSSGSNWRISVANEGDSIPNENKEMIFNRFTRLEKGTIKGTGLGLAIAKKIIQLHAGNIWAEDNPKGGSIFIVEIPKFNP